MIQSKSQSIADKCRNARSSGQLNLSNRELQFIPSEVLHLYNREYLQEGEKHWLMANLKTLDLSFNRLEELPTVLKQPECQFLHDSLQTFIVKNNQLRTCGPVCALLNLVTLDLSHNTISVLPTDISRIHNLATLKLDDNRLKALPPLPKSLRVLSFNRNKVAKLPPNLQSLTKLEDLSGCNNSISSIRSLNALSRLAHLNLAQNNLSQLSNELFKSCTSIIRLDLRENNLYHYPMFGPKNQLQELYLGLNPHLQQPSEQFWKHLTSLSVLDLQSTGITLIPPQIASLRSLRRLDLRMNSLRDLPPVLGYMQLLKTLSIKGNPIRNEMVHSNMARGIGDLKAYLRKRGKPPKGMHRHDTTTGKNSMLDPHESDADLEQMQLEALKNQDPVLFKKTSNRDIWVKRKWGCYPVCATEADTAS